MLKAISPVLPVDFQIPGDDENPTIFKLKPLTGLESLDVYYHASLNENKDVIFDAEGAKKALKYSLSGWDNMEGAEYTGDFEKDIAVLDTVTIQTLFKEIMRISHLGRNLKKK